MSQGHAGTLVGRLADWHAQTIDLAFQLSGSGLYEIAERLEGHADDAFEELLELLTQPDP